VTFKAPIRRARTIGLISLLVLLSAGVSFHRRIGTALTGRPADSGAAGGSETPRSRLPARGAAPWRDSLGDGFPDGARLESAPDRENFLHWFTFLAEAQYYLPSPAAQEEIQDCSALIRYAYRNALMSHSAAWHHSAGLRYDPGFGDIVEFAYPQWPLGKALFRTRPGPFAPEDLKGGGFAEFADSATLLRYNTYRVSRELRAARPGDLLFFYQYAQRQPYHAMMFVGGSHFQPRGSDWIVYHTGDLNGQPGEVREVQGQTLLEHPDARWRPLESNPRFLGVYRLEILR
jgi:uncharacterized protein YfaT (DUF1175 family)